MRETLLELYPFVKDYIYDKTEKDIYSCSLSNRKYFLFKCQNCNGEWSAQIRNIISTSRICPFCNNRKVLKGFNDLHTKNPELAKEYSISNSININEILYVSNLIVNWTCSKCNYEWKTTVRSRTIAKTGCRKCFTGGKEIQNKKVSIKNRYPNLVETWDYDKNIITPEESFSTREKYWWKCKRGNHSYKSTVFLRKSNSCGVCKGKVILIGVNDAKSRMSKELIKEWSPKNNLAPENYTFGSDEKVYWICSNNHEWEAEIGRRIIRGDKCSICSGKKLKSGFNDLKTFIEENSEYKYILEEWDNRNIQNPESYSKMSSEKVYWICSNGHQWMASISNRMKGNMCKLCRSSIGETQISNFILKKDLNLKIDRNTSLPLEGKEIDIYIPELKVGIEYNGMYWHSDQIIFKNRGLKSYDYHKSKLDLANKKGISLLFVWEDDWNEKNELVQSAIERVLQDKSDIDPILTILSKG